jgi:hypothetical protein
MALRTVELHHDARRLRCRKECGPRSKSGSVASSSPRRAIRTVAADAKGRLTLRCSEVNRSNPASQDKTPRSKRTRRIR